MCSGLLIENQRKCENLVQHGENAFFVKKCKIYKQNKKMEMYCICYTKKIEIRDNVVLAMRARNIESPENIICAKNIKNTKK